MFDNLETLIDLNRGDSYFSERVVSKKQSDKLRGGLIRCFKCGLPNHMATNCLALPSVIESDRAIESSLFSLQSSRTHC